MFGITFFWKLLVLTSAISLASCLTAEQERQIDELVDTTYIRPNGIPGMGLAIVQLDENGIADVLTKGYGLRDVDKALPANNDTLFCIASITKGFASTVVVKTLHEIYPELGESALDYPISKMIPNFNFTLSDRYRYESLTFRDLLSHRTCLSTFYIGRSVGSIETAEEFAYRTRYVKEICPYRTDYKYNNGMYALAGHLIGAVANSTFAQLAQSLLLELGMTDTVILQATLNFDELPNASRGYYRNNNVIVQSNSELFKRMHVALPSGGLMASPRDISRYMTFQLNYGNLDGRQIVPENVMRRLHKAGNTLTFRAGNGGVQQSDYSYALGLRLGFYNEWPLVSHEGNWPPFSTRMSLFPTLKIGIFTTTNGPGALSTGHTTLHQEIFQVITGLNGTLEKPMEKPKIVKPRTSSRKPVPEKLETLVSKRTSRIEPQDMAGLYGNGVHGEFTVKYNVSDHQGSLYLQFGVWGTGYLEPFGSSGNIFNIVWDSDIISDFLSQSTTLPISRLDFSVDNVVNFRLGSDRADFFRNATLDTFPSQSWESGSCGPESFQKSISV